MTLQEKQDLFDRLREAAAKIDGEDPVLVRDMAWDMARPCSDCPFLKSSPFHNGIARSLPTYQALIDAGHFAHTCHKTDPRKACDGPQPQDGRPVQHCAGALLSLLKTGDGYDLQLPLLLAAESGKFDVHAMTKAAEADDTIHTIPELMQFYLSELEAHLEPKP
jgi:hypothetical protein